MTACDKSNTDGDGTRSADIRLRRSEGREGRADQGAQARSRGRQYTEAQIKDSNAEKIKSGCLGRGSKDNNPCLVSVLSSVGKIVNVGTKGGMALDASMFDSEGVEWAQRSGAATTSLHKDAIGEGVKDDIRAWESSANEQAWVRVRVERAESVVVNHVLEGQIDWI